MSPKSFTDRPIVITGSSGMLGTDLAEVFSSKLKNIITFDHRSLDITDKDLVFSTLSEIKPLAVINAAAYTNVDGAETEREKALAVNVLGPKILSDACSRLQSRLVHYSTDYVFDGNSGNPWTEEDKKNPPTPNYYAQTKLEGENAVLENQNALVLRVQWLYGKTRDRFTTLKDKKTFTPLTDQWGAPTWSREIASCTLKLLEKEAKGLFHYSYDDSATWFEVYSFVKEELGFSTEFKPTRLSELTLPAKRPRYCVLSNRKLVKFLGVDGMGSWKRPLKEFLHSV